MKFKFKFLLTLVLGLFVQFSYAQQKTVTGTVIDEQGIPLPGVNVIVEGTVTGTQTDFDGNYSINGEVGETIVFSFVGFQSVEQVIGTSDTINVTLVEAAGELDEVVVVGYGTQSKRKLTDNISKLTSEDISEVPTPSIQNAIAGKAAGVQVSQVNGKVEGGVNIRIRGVASIGAGSEPLYVLDGVPLINNNESNNGAPTNPLVTLSSNEIESIDILKDASAAAVYGSRGANGVVIITTKKGKQGKGRFSLNYSTGVSEPTNTREWLNSDEYIELMTEAAVNSFGEADGTEYIEGIFDFLANGTDWRNREVDTDWQDLAFQNGQTTDADVSVSGGTENTSYFFSGAYNNTKGIITGNDLERVTGRANISHRVSDKFRAGMNISFSRTEIDRIANDNAFVNPIQAIAQPAISPAYLENGDPNPNTIYPNFLLQEKHAFFKTNIRRVTGKTFAEYLFFPSLKFNTDFGYDLYYQTEDNYVGRLAPFQSTNGQAYASSVGTESYVSSNYFTYDKSFGNIHDLEVVVGMEYNHTNRRFQSVTGIEFPTDDFTTIASAAEITAGNGSLSGNRFLSYFGRATYSYLDRYLFKASIRHDGSSRFGSENQFGTFPSLAGGWIISEEEFLRENDVLSLLKFRVSWGKTGNANIGDFASRNLFTGISYNQRPGIVPSQAGNTLLTWENVEQYNYGVDFGIINDRITGSVDYYVKNSDGLLFSVPLPGTSGQDFITRNIGVMQNSGIEFALNTDNVVRDNFTWSTSFNLSQNRNEVISLPNNGADIITGQNIFREGQPISAFYMLEYAGVDPENGDALYFTNEEGGVSGETTNNPNDARRVVAGSPYPLWIGGLTNTMNFGGFDFNFTFQGEWGADIYNAGGIYQSANGDYFDNQSRDQLNRWQQPGDITDVPQARLFGANGTVQSTRYLQNADFIRLRNLTFGYTIPAQVTENLKLETFRVYFTGFNLLTFTDYDGYDPEARSDAGQGAGVDFYSPPPARTYSVGVNINF